jgi:hypothetical protein
MNRREFCTSLALLSTSPWGTSNSQEEDVVVRPQEYAGAIRNPLKGLRSGDAATVVSHPFASLAKAYIKWNEVEDRADDGIERIKTFCDKQWKDVQSSNAKVIPRVYLEWPNRGRYWPSDMTPGDYSSAEFKRRLVRMIEKLGKSWNSDPRVAYVETGLIGLWGEQHDPSPTPELQKLMGDAFVSNFPDKLLMNRYPGDFVDYNFGIYWDSFGHKEESPGHIPLLKSPRLIHRWMTAPMGGETAFDWGTPLGRDPTDAAVSNCDKIVGLIRDLHWNHLGWLSDYDPRNQVAVENGARLQKALGYRFVIDEVRFPATIRAGKDFRMSFLVRNAGSSPFYYCWPVELSLLDPTTRKPVWKTLFKGVDIRKWLPDSTEPFQIANTFTCPTGLEQRCYIAALSILDPAGNEPSVRFAIKNYYHGGRHPVGCVGVGATPGPLPDSFDDPARDWSLTYALS